MDRRTFVAIGASAFALLFAVRGQPASVHRIGFLALVEPPYGQRKKIVAELARRGWVEGANLVIEWRSAGGDAARLRAFADELARLKVELIIGFGTIASQAAKGATARIPIVIYASGDPVGSGLVRSLAHPGGNVTGTSLRAPDISMKRLELLREILPGATRVALLINPENPVYRARRDEEERAGRTLGMQVMFAEATEAKAIDSALQDAARRGCQALIIGSEPLFGSNADQLMSTVRRLALPAMVDNMDEGDAALIAFGPDWDELDRHVALFVDRILKGASPGTLPIVEPTRYRLTVNLRRAQALGITVPASVLLRADAVFR
jgi:putative ABC transport system substrate-binding protein